MFDKVTIKRKRESIMRINFDNMDKVSEASYLSAPSVALYRTIMRILYREKQLYNSRLSTTEIMEKIIDPISDLGFKFLFGREKISEPVLRDLFEKKEAECESLDDKWIYNIKNMGIRQEVAFKQNSEVFRRLEEVANVATLTPQQRYDYEADVKIVRDTLNQIRGAYQDGEQKGFMKGEQKGRAEGKMDVAREMKKRGMKVGDIMLFTGLSEQQISSL